MTLREFVVHWQENWDREHSRPSTYAAHGYLLKNHILSGLGDTTLSELTEKRIGEFLEERRRFGGHRPEKPDYPGEELGYLPLFILALTAGLRQRELIALQWSDLDAERCTLTIDEGRSVVNGTLVEYSGNTRTIPLTEEVRKQLFHEHSTHPNSPLMFVNPSTQKPLSPKAVRRMHSEIIQRAGLDHVRFTDLRHTCAVNALKNGMEVRELSRMLGHAKTTTTRWDYSSYLSQSELKREEQQIVTELDELKQASMQMENLFEF